MIAFDKVKEIVFDEVTVWCDRDGELYFYRWAWEKITSSLETDDTVEAIVIATALAYVYAELCYYVCDQNFYDDLWYRIGEFADADADLQLGFMCGELGEEYCPDDAEEAMQILVREYHERVVEALQSIETMNLLTAFHASHASPQHLVTDEDGDEMEDDMIESYGDFVRYIDDAEFRDEDLEGMSTSDYEAAYGWWENGAEMLDARTDEDEY